MTRLCAGAVAGAVLSLGVATGSAGVARAAEVVEAHDLQAAGEEVRRTGAPLLLVVSRHDCGYCAVLRREILGPMVASGEYRGRAVIRELFLDGPPLVRDFDGRDATPDDVAGRYRATFTPTMLLLDARGRELVSPLRGLGTVELFGFYVDRAIDAAGERLSAPGRRYP